ncbi:MAG: ABC transporter ATP-binding protein, partial [Leptolyngbyaceae cyanobacterium SM2_5_2]|nr:ABC transporter ATP-binding protein [Leptolyngbyaceae cyanobacterium SM2_5_2]
DRIINLVDGRIESDENVQQFVESHDPKHLDGHMFMM